MDMRSLIAHIRTLPNCRMFLPVGLPVISPPHVLPEDLYQFYDLCGGATLFAQSDYSISIVSPEEVVPANPVIVGDLYPEDISSTWYIIAKTEQGEFVTIDLSQERLGRCYDSFWDQHGIAGSCPIVATSFTDFLTRLVTNAGQYWYWLRPDFASRGDAYD